MGRRRSRRGSAAAARADGRIDALRQCGLGGSLQSAAVRSDVDDTGVCGGVGGVEPPSAGAVRERRGFRGAAAVERSRVFRLPAGVAQRRNGHVAGHGG